MSAMDSRNFRGAGWLALAFAGAAVTPLACFFPSYTYDLPNGTGGTGSTTSSTKTTTSTTSMSTSTGPSTATSTSTGETSTTTSTSTSTGMGGAGSSSSSSTGGPPCASRDCSDPTCSGSFACVPATPPTGWMGYFSLYDGAASKEPGGCGSDYPNDAYDGNNQISVPNPMCSTCTCTPPNGATCQMSGMADTMHSGYIDPIIVGDAACGGSINCGGPLEVLPTWNGACYAVDGFNGGTTTCGAGSDCTNGTAPCNVSLSVNQLQVGGGSCTASTQSANIPPVTWGTAGKACGGPTPGTGCSGSSEVCLPIPESPFHSGVCIMQTGKVSCPPGQFSEQHVFYSDKTDTRSCSDCSCGPPTGDCSATVTVYSATTQTCSGLVTTLHPTTSAGDCKNITGNPTVSGREAVFSAVTNGSCPPSGGQAMGTATPANPTTFCCIP